MALEHGSCNGTGLDDILGNQRVATLMALPAIFTTGLGSIGRAFYQTAGQKASRLGMSAGEARHAGIQGSATSLGRGAVYGAAYEGKSAGQGATSKKDRKR